VFELLEAEMDIDPVKFDRVYAPIGIAIGARNPAEIAVCIVEVLRRHRRPVLVPAPLPSSDWLQGVHPSDNIQSDPDANKGCRARMSEGNSMIAA
jgi:hypothetical protein